MKIETKEVKPLPPPPVEYVITCSREELLLIQECMAKTNLLELCSAKKVESRFAYDVYQKVYEGLYPVKK